MRARASRKSGREGNPTYLFRRAIPKDLRGRLPGRSAEATRIIESLHTSDIKVAARAAGKRWEHWETVFERVRQDVPLSLAEIEDAARETYTATLARLAREAEASPDGDEALWLYGDVETRKTALERGDPTLALPEIEAIERRSGIRLDRASPTFKTAAMAILRAQEAAYAGRLRALEGHVSERPATFLGPAGIDPVTLQPVDLQRPIAPRIAGEIGPWSLFKEWVAAVQPAAATTGRWRAVFEALQKKFGSHRITADDAQAWLDGLIDPDGTRGQRRSAYTVDATWRSAARCVYGWALGKKKVDRNPFAACKIDVPRKKVTRGKAFTATEVSTILRAATASDASTVFGAAKRFAPYIAAYSGARMGEVTQLRGQDIKKIDGHWCMELTPDAGSVKSGTFRVVPLHPALLEQGFLKFAASRRGPLFYVPGGKAKDQGATATPSRPRSVKCRERLAAWVRSLGVDDKRISPNHAFRHTFKQLANRSGISETLSQEIMGHEQDTEARNYGRPTLGDMADALERFPRYEV
jgi:integrase